MFKSYFRTLLRNILRNKFYTFLNVLGLTVGISTAIFILLYIQDELNYDKHHENHKRIFRLESEFVANNNVDLYATVPIPIGPTLKIEIPEIEYVVRFDRHWQSLFHHQHKEYIENNFFFTDSTVFDVFTHKFIFGNPQTSLTEPNSIVLTEKTAKRYFGNQNPMGKLISNKEVEFILSPVLNLVGWVYRLQLIKIQHRPYSKITRRQIELWSATEKIR